MGNWYAYLGSYKSKSSGITDSSSPESGLSIEESETKSGSEQELLSSGEFVRRALLVAIDLVWVLPGEKKSMVSVEEKQRLRSWRDLFKYYLRTRPSAA